MIGGNRYRTQGTSTFLNAALALGSNQVVAPLFNNSGTLLIRRMILQSVANNLTVLAKASAPASVTDGDILAYLNGSTILNLYDEIKVGAGKGLYVWSGVAGSQLAVIGYDLQ